MEAIDAAIRDMVQEGGQSTPNLKPFGDVKFDAKKYYEKNIKDQDELKQGNTPEVTAQNKSLEN